MLFANVMFLATQLQMEGSRVGSLAGSTQRAQYPLIREYTLNYRGLRIMIYKVYSLIKGYWALWVILSHRVYCEDFEGCRCILQPESLNPKPFGFWV